MVEQNILDRQLEQADSRFARIIRIVQTRKTEDPPSALAIKALENIEKLKDLKYPDPTGPLILEYASKLRNLEEFQKQAEEIRKKDFEDVNEYKKRVPEKVRYLI